MTIQDEGGNPVSGATVSGFYSGNVSGSPSGVTDAVGEVVLTSDLVFSRPNIVELCVSGVTHAVLAYNPAANANPTFACAGVAPTVGDYVGFEPSMESTEMPRTFALLLNYPNPFNTATTIRFALPEASEVLLEVYDLMGRRISVLVEGQLGAGHYERVWDSGSDTGEHITSGVYIYRLQAGSFDAIRRMVLMK